MSLENLARLVECSTTEPGGHRLGHVFGTASLIGVCRFLLALRSIHERKDAVTGGITAFEYELSLSVTHD